MSTSRRRFGLPLRATAFFLGTWGAVGATVEAGDGLLSWFRHKHGARVDAAGTLGYGPPGLHPGYQGFGLSFQKGYGYGGDALGVGVEGGYPFYGGPGYAHPAPELNRFKLTGIEPFPYYGGPGGPSPEHRQYFDGGPRPLVVDRPVISTAEGDSGGYGSFSGMMPYPDSAFAPSTTRASGEASAPGASSATSTTAPRTPPGE